MKLEWPLAVFLSKGLVNVTLGTKDSVDYRRRWRGRGRGWRRR